MGESQTTLWRRGQVRAVGFPRPLQAYAGALEAAGLLTAAIREVTAPDDAAADDPAVLRWQRIPLFLHLRAAKAA
jgi:hypothetical protein